MMGDTMEGKKEGVGKRDGVGKKERGREEREERVVGAASRHSMCLFLVGRPSDHQVAFDRGP